MISHTLSMEEVEEFIGAINGIARALRDLGNADASTPMGAIEAFGKVVQEDVCDALRSIGDNIGEGLTAINSSIDRHSESIDGLASLNNARSR